MKKGSALRYFNVLVLLVVSILVLSLFLGKLKTATLGTVDKSMCKESVRTAAGAKIVWEGSVVIGDRMPISCGTKYITRSYKEKDEDKIKQEIANAMYECWDNFHRGTLEIFDTTDQNFCVVCSRLDFPEYKKRPGERKINDFVEFLLDKQVPLKGMSYYTFLQGEDATPGITKGDYLAPKVMGGDITPESTEEEVEEVIQEALKTVKPEPIDDIKDLEHIQDYDYMNAPDLSKGPIAVAFLSTKNALKGKIETMGTGAQIGAGVGVGLLIIASFIPVVNVGVWVIAGTMVASTGAGAVFGFMSGADHPSDYINSLGLMPARQLKNYRCTWLEGEHGLAVIDRSDPPEFKLS